MIEIFIIIILGGEPYVRPTESAEHCEEWAAAVNTVPGAFAYCVEVESDHA